MTPQKILEILQTHYRDRWHIRTTGTLWIATAVDRNTDREPTVIEYDIDAFIDKLENPGPRYGNGHPLLRALGWSQRRPGTWLPPE